MAYTFNAINNMLGQENDNGKQNIFNQGSSGGGDQSSGGGSQGSQAVEKDVGGGALGSQNQTSAQPTQQQAKPKGNSAQAIMQKAQKSNMDTSKFTQGIQSNIAENQKNLENQASSFVQNQAARARQGVDSGTVRAAAGGDADAYGRVETTLRAPNTQAENFQFGGNTRFQDLDNMSTQGGLQQTLSKKGPAMYNQGQAALDSMLISKDKNYQKNLLEAKKQRDALRSRQQELEGGSMQQAAQAQINAQEARAREQALAELAAYRGEIESGVDRRMGNYFNLLEQAKQRSGGELSAMEQDLRGEIARENAALGDFVGGANVNEGDFASFNSPFRAREEFYTPESAQNYNRILDLLGEGGTRYSGVQDFGSYSNYNREGMKAALLEQARKAKEADDMRKEKIRNTPVKTMKDSNSGGGGYVGQVMKKIFA